MKKNLLVIVLTFYSLSTIGQVTSSTELDQLLKSIENKTEKKEDIVAKYATGSESRQNTELKTDPWTQAILNIDKKRELGGFSKIKDSELYTTQSDGTRKAKYPYIPRGATTIQQVEKYFKEHPSEMKNFKKK